MNTSKDGNGIDGFTRGIEFSQLSSRLSDIKRTVERELANTIGNEEVKKKIEESRWFNFRQEVLSESFSILRKKNIEDELLLKKLFKIPDSIDLFELTGMKPLSDKIRNMRLTDKFRIILSTKEQQGKEFLFDLLFPDFDLSEFITILSESSEENRPILILTFMRLLQFNTLVDLESVTMIGKEIGTKIVKVPSNIIYEMSKKIGNERGKKFVLRSFMGQYNLESLLGLYKVFHDKDLILRLISSITYIDEHVLEEFMMIDGNNRYDNLSDSSKLKFIFTSLENMSESSKSYSIKRDLMFRLLFKNIEEINLDDIISHCSDDEINLLNILLGIEYSRNIKQIAEQKGEMLFIDRFWIVKDCYNFNTRKLISRFILDNIKVSEIKDLLQNHGNKDENRQILISILGMGSDGLDKLLSGSINNDKKVWDLIESCSEYLGRKIIFDTYFSKKEKVGGKYSMIIDEIVMNFEGIDVEYLKNNSLKEILTSKRWNYETLRVVLPLIRKGKKLDKSLLLSDTGIGKILQCNPHIIKILIKEFKIKDINIIIKLPRLIRILQEKNDDLNFIRNLPLFIRLFSKDITLEDLSRQTIADMISMVRHELFDFFLNGARHIRDMLKHMIEIIGENQLQHTCDTNFEKSERRSKITQLLGRYKKMKFKSFSISELNYDENRKVLTTSNLDNLIICAVNYMITENVDSVNELAIFSKYYLDILPVRVDIPELIANLVIIHYLMLPETLKNKSNSQIIEEGVKKYMHIRKEREKNIKSGKGDSLQWRDIRLQQFEKDLQECIDKLK